MNKGTKIRIEIRPEYKEKYLFLVMELNYKFDIKDRLYDLSIDIEGPKLDHWTTECHFSKEDLDMMDVRSDDKYAMGREIKSHATNVLAKITSVILAKERMRDISSSIPISSVKSLASIMKEEIKEALQHAVQIAYINLQDGEAEGSVEKPDPIGDYFLTNELNSMSVTTYTESESKLPLSEIDNK